MSIFWSTWITVLTIAVLVICVVLLTWNLKNFVGVPEKESTGHEFDGISEINNPLPKWWTIMFYATLVWSVFYFAAYPGLGNWKGLLNWTSSNQGVQSLAESKAAVEANKAAGTLSQLDRENEHANETYAKEFAKYTSRSIEELAADADALKVGQRLFLQNCAQCHGSDARGQKGFPNLTDNDWLYGGTSDKIVETITHGRKAAMPAWAEALGDQGIKEVTAYVLSLSGRKVNDKDAAAGQARFALCAACHGADGKGSLAHNLPFGAPNLTDNTWLYGGSVGTVEETLRKGRNGQMPAFGQVLGNDKIHVISAYVYSLSHGEQKK